MRFCGQCGTLLAPYSTTCPSCGAVTEPELGTNTVEDFSTDAPTIASSLSSLASGGSPPNVQQPSAQPGQQKLVLRPDGAPIDAYSYDVHTSTSSPYPNNAMAQPGHTPMSQSETVSPPGFGQLSAQPRRKGGLVALFIGLLVLLLILGTTALVVLRQNNQSPMPAQQARALLQRYYNDINQQNYHDAYNLWAPNPQHPRPSYDQFASGYANTKHDDITFDSIALGPKGNVQVVLTIYATEITPSGTAQHVYQGTYLVGPQNGTWKILRGQARQVS